MKAANAPVSASELEKSLKCMRLWAARYRWDEWPDPSTGAMHFALGGAYHKVAEKYLTMGILPADPTDPLCEMLMAALPYLPAPGTLRLIERKEVFEYRGVPYEVTADGVGAGIVIDHKTGKDPQRYGLIKREDKLKNVQTMLYSFKYLMPEGGVFDHIYIKKHRAAVAMYEGITGDKLQSYPPAPKAFGTPIHFTGGEIQQQMDTFIHPAADRIYQLRRKHDRIDPMTLPPAPAPEPGKKHACIEFQRWDPDANAYVGACPHLDRCWPHGYIGPMSEDTPAPKAEASRESLADRIARLRGGKPESSTTTSPLAEVVADLEKVLARLRGLL